MSRRGSKPKKTASGMWQTVVDVAPRGAHRRQVKLRARTQRELQAKVVELLGNIERGTHVDPSAMTVGEWVNPWCDGLPTTGLRTSSSESYTDLMRGLVTPRIGGARLQSLLPADLNRLYASLLAEGRRSGRGLSNRTVRYVHTIVRKCLADAVREGLLARNPADLAKPPSLSSTRAPEMQTWEPEELRQFLALVESDRLAALYRLAGMTGLRLGEMCGLRWADLEDGRLQVHRQVTVAAGAPLLADVKTDRSRRSVELDPETIVTLGHHRRAQLEERMALGLASRPEMMFTQPDGSLLDPEGVSRTFTRHVKVSGLPRITFHGLRHSHATHLIKAGTHVKVIADRLGHSSASFTLDRYGHVLRGMGADAAVAVAALVDGGER
jgi:integrase